MKKRTIVIGGGMAGMNSTLKLLEAKEDVLLISDVLGGRIVYDKKEKVNFGAYFIMANYNNAKKLVTRETQLKPTTACFHNSTTEFFPVISGHTLTRSVEFLRFLLIMKDFAKRYEVFKTNCLVMSQKEAMDRDPYFREAFNKPAAVFIKEKKIEKVAYDYVSKFSYACTGVPMDRISTLDFLNVSMGMIVPIHRFKFDAEGMAERLGKHFLQDKVTEIHSDKDGHTVITERGATFKADAIILATPAFVTKRLLNLGDIRDTCQLFVFHVTAKMKKNFTKYEMNLFPFASEIIFTSIQDDGSYLIYTREKEADLYQVCENYELISMRSWEKAMYVTGRAFMEQQIGDSIFIAGDHNGLGLEPAAISGIYAANQILKKIKQ